MAFHVYPDPQTNPLTVAVGTTSPPIAIDQLTGVDPVTTLTSMYVRIAMLGASCGVVPPASSLGVILQVSNGAGTTTGAAVELPPAPPEAPTNTVVIRNAPGGNGDEVNARLVAEGNGVYLLTIFFVAAPPGSFSNWKISLKNKAAAVHGFTWVVASSASETSQPWIDIPDDLPYDALTTQSVPLTIQVANKGTGPLTITDVGGSALGSNFTLTTVPASIAPNGCGNLLVTFSAPATPGISSTNYTVTSNDTTAVMGNPAAAHNKRIALSATARMLEVALILDASGSMDRKPNGDVAGSPSDSRWSKLNTSTEQFLDLLGDFGSGVGRFGVGVFPDVVSVPPRFSESADVQAATDISAATIMTAKTTLATLAPKWVGTPIGDGIVRGMGETAGSYGYFRGDANSLLYNRRWMVLMSDGAHNGGPPDPPAFYGVGPTSFRGKKIKAATVAYGEPGSWEVDHALLGTIATESDGLALDAGADDVGIDPVRMRPLHKAFLDSLVAGLSLTPAVDPGGILTGDAPEARHTITITPYDTQVAIVVNWSTLDENRLNVQLLTPTCELITPSVALEHADLVYHAGGRYQIYTIKDAYLRNVNDPANPRYGAWRLIISSDGLYEEETEGYDFNVITQSRIKLVVERNRPEYFTGDTIELAARLTVDGSPILNAAVNLQLATPGQSAANWLAFNAVTPVELEKATQALEGREPTVLQIKAYALQQKGVFFERFVQPSTIAMLYDENSGLYKAVINNTSVPETRDFYVTAIGHTADGVSFPREQRLQVRVVARPEPKFTLFDIVYRRLGERGQFTNIATIRVLPRDRFGNVVMIDPNFDPSFNLTAKGGEFTGQIANNLDGSYTRILHYKPEETPVIGLLHGGEEIKVETKIVPVLTLHFVNEVVEFVIGGEAEKGANKYTNPRAALGSVYQRVPDPFVALGASGALTVRIKDQYILAQGEDDITVFVETAANLHPYLVEVLVDQKDKDEKDKDKKDKNKSAKWVTLGESAGITQSFSLKDVGIKAARAIRIIDTSNRTRDNALEPLDAPGVSIGGVGCKRIGKPPAFDIGELSIEELRGIDSGEIKRLNRAEIKTISQLIAAEPTTLNVDIELARRLDLHAKAVVALDSVLELRNVNGLGDWSIWRINTAARAAVLAAAKAPAEEVDQLLEQVSAFRISLRRKLLKQITLAQLVGE